MTGLALAASRTGLAAAGAALLALGAARAVAADDLPRRVDWGWSLSEASAGPDGAAVRAVTEGGAAARAGVRAGDRVVAVGGLRVDGRAALARLRWAARPGAPTAVTLVHDRERLEVRVAPPAAEVERHPGIETALGAVAGPGGARLRTLTTSPAGDGRTAGILVVGWVSCDSVETPAERRGGVEQLLADVVERSGAVVLRVDKPGAGDSEGVCADTDFLAELAGYRRALAALRAHPRVDPARLAVLGISNGGGVAPLVARGEPVAAYVTVGAWSKTWFEHMLDLERRRLVLAGTAPDAIGPALKRLSELHAVYLFDRVTPGEAMRRRPHLAGAWYDAPDAQYGRPARFYHQLQDLDLAAAWGRVRAPTLVVWGEWDWIMDRGDQEQIVRLVNGGGARHARLLAVPRMDHAFSLQPDAGAAFARMGGGAYPAEAAREILEFLRAVR